MNAQLNNLRIYPESIDLDTLNLFLSKLQTVDVPSPFKDSNGNIVSEDLSVKLIQETINGGKFYSIASLFCKRGYLVSEFYFNFYQDLNSQGFIPYNFLKDVSLINDSNVHRTILSYFNNDNLFKANNYKNSNDFNLLDLSLKTHYSRLKKSEKLLFFKNVYLLFGEILRVKVNGNWMISLKQDFSYEPLILIDNKPISFIHWFKDAFQGRYTLTFDSMINATLSTYKR